MTRLRSKDSSGLRAARTAAMPLALACAALLTHATGASAGGTGATVAKASVTGELSGALTAPGLQTASDGLTEYGCQVSPNTDQDVTLNFKPAKVKLDGHATTVSRMLFGINVTKDGNTESLAPQDNSFNNSLTFELKAGGRLYAWQSVAGTVRSSAGARSGSFNATLAPSGSQELPMPDKTAASASIHMRGSWTGCHTGE
jgi:hypothetical protein